MGTVRDIRAFRADLARFAGKERERATRVFRDTCGVVTENIVAGGKYGPGTPVDTGFAINSWVSGINGEGQYVQPSHPERAHGAPLAPPSPPAAIIEQLKLGETYFLTSNCVYMRTLDYGHSQQAPSGHVRLVMQQLPAIASDVAHSDLPMFAAEGP